MTRLFVLPVAAAVTYAILRLTFGRPLPRRECLEHGEYYAAEDGCPVCERVGGRGARRRG